MGAYLRYPIRAPSLTIVAWAKIDSGTAHQDTTCIQAFVADY